MTTFQSPSSTRRAARTPRGFVPRLEPLEDRSLPSVTFLESSGTLFIKGDNRGDTIQIVDRGTAGPGSLVVTANGTTHTTATAIDNIVLRTGHGKDHVSYVLTGDLQAGVHRNVSVNLGRGNDAFAATLDGSLAANSRLTLDVTGRRGKDSLGVNATAPVNLAAGSQLALLLHAGPGKETASVDYTGLLDGNLVVFIDVRGHGKNRGHVHIVPLPGSTGTVQNGPGSSPVPVGQPTSNPVGSGTGITVSPVVTVTLPGSLSVQPLDLSQLGLGAIGQGVLNLGQNVLSGLNVLPLDVSQLGLAQLALGLTNGVLNFGALTLNDLGTDLSHLAVGLVDLDQLKQGVLSLGLLDPSKLNLGNIMVGPLDLSALGPLTGPSGTVSVLANLGLGVGLQSLSFIDLMALQRPHLGLAVCDLSRLAQGVLQIGIIDVGALGLQHPGLGLLTPLL